MNIACYCRSPVSLYHVFAKRLHPFGHFFLVIKNSARLTNMFQKTTLVIIVTSGLSNSVDPDQGKRSVAPDLDPNCLHISSLNISEEMLDAPQENCCCFHFINIYVNV